MSQVSKPSSQPSFCRIQPENYTLPHSSTNDPGYRFWALVWLSALTWLPGFIQHESLGMWLFSVIRIIFLGYIALYVSMWQNIVFSLVNLAFVSTYHHPALGMVLGGIGINQLLRCSTICRHQSFFKERNFAYRVMFSISMSDIRTAHERVVSWLQVSFYFLMMSLGAMLLGDLRSRFGDSHFLLLRYTSLFIAFCGMMIYNDYFYRLCLGAFGMHIPSNYQGLFQQRTLAGIWSHWNRGTALQLRTLFFDPLYQIGHPTLGAFVAFLVSALMHLMPLIAIHAGWRSILGTALFFLIQFPILIFERQMHLRGIPYLFVVFVLTLPLFLEFYCRPGLSALTM